VNRKMQLVFDLTEIREFTWYFKHFLNDRSSRHVNFKRAIEPADDLASERRMSRVFDTSVHPRESRSGLLT